MKKALAVCLAGLMCCTLVGCGGKGGKMEEQPVQDYTGYTLEGYTAPVWKQSVLGNESVMFVGKDDVAPLLFQPDRIISVRSMDLKTTYEENTDYILEDGKIKLTENTRIPYWEKSDYYPAEKIKDHTFAKVGGGFLLYGEGTTFTSKQIAVTYSHSNVWKGYVPQDYSSKMGKVLEKLRAKKPVTIVFYGDSIMAGNYTSVGAPQWCDMIGDYLAARFGYEKREDIQVINRSLGGADSVWAYDNLKENVIDLSPDLLVYGFGMNDYGSQVSQYSGRTQKVVNKVRAECENTNILLVAPFLPNPEAEEFDKNQKYFEPELQTLAENYPDVGVACVTSLHKELLKTKRYYDMTFNNVNHPNETMCRVYASTVLQALLGKEYITLDPTATKE